MGFFSDAWNSTKNAGKWFGNALVSAGRGIAHGFNTVVNTVAPAVNTANEFLGSEEGKALTGVATKELDKAGYTKTASAIGRAPKIASQANTAVNSAQAFSTNLTAVTGEGGFTAKNVEGLIAGGKRARQDFAAVGSQKTRVKRARR